VDKCRRKTDDGESKIGHTEKLTVGYCYGAEQWRIKILNPVACFRFKTRIYISVAFLAGSQRSPVKPLPFIPLRPSNIIGSLVSEPSAPHHVTALTSSATTLVKSEFCRNSVLKQATPCLNAFDFSASKQYYATLPASVAESVKHRRPSVCLSVCLSWLLSNAVSVRFGPAVRGPRYTCSNGCTSNTDGI